MSKTHTIKLQDLEILQHRIEVLNLRAKKLGCEPAVVEVIEMTTRKVSKILPGGRKIFYEIPVATIQVHGDTPCLKGWRLIAKVEYLEGEKLVKSVPGVECPESFRTRGIECDHCRSDRNRKSVFVLKHEDGQYVQVGRSCLKDFLGGVSPDQLLSQASWGFTVSELANKASDGFSGGGMPECIDIIEYLNAVSICIRRLGWVSRRMADLDESTTASDAWYLLRPGPTEINKHERWVENNDLIHQPRDEKLAAEALAWAIALPVHGSSDYLYNLGVATRAGYVTHKTKGLVASCISIYLKHIERQAELGCKPTPKSRQHIGTIKSRQVFEKLTVLKMSYIDGNYGTTTLVIFEDEPGNLIKWFASVKKHGDYSGVKETLINRAVILEIL